MSATLFPVFATHCFYGCNHKAVAAIATESNDAMERHYWDAHYTQADRDKMRAEGQQPERIGSKQ